MICTIEHKETPPPPTHLSEEAAVVGDDLHEAGVALGRVLRHALNHGLQLGVRLHQLRLDLHPQDEEEEKDGDTWCVMALTGHLVEHVRTPNQSDESSYCIRTMLVARQP